MTGVFKIEIKLNLCLRTLPPVTEKFAKIQYLSFLWPVYVLRH